MHDAPTRQFVLTLSGTLEFKTAKGETFTINPGGVLSVNAHEDVRQHVVSLAGTEAFRRSARARRKVEMCFAHLKRNLNFRRLRLRGMTGARDECTLAAIAQNLRKLVKMVGFSPPSLSAASAQLK